MNFTTWWEQNKVLYEHLVKEEIARTIWCAAADNIGAAILQNLIKSS